MNYIIAFGIFAFIIIFLVIYALNITKNETLIRNKLNEITKEQNFETEFTLNVDENSLLSVTEKLFYPFIISSYNFFSKFLPDNYLDNLADKLICAGKIDLVKNSKEEVKNLAAQYLGKQGLLSLILPLFLTILFIVSKGSFFNIIVLDIVSFLSVFVFSNFMLSKQITKRQERIKKDLPFALELLNISVQAGAGFDSAMNKVATNMEGPISQEFRIVLKDKQFETRKNAALQAMADRVKVPDVNEFVVSIIQTEKVGTGVSEVLKIQSQTMRLKAKQRAQEKAFKAPVKMLFPMVMFIFPSIFIVLLGPALMFIPKMLKGL